MQIIMTLFVQNDATNFHKILYTELNLLIGYKFGNLYPRVRNIAGIRAISYLHIAGVLF